MAADVMLNKNTGTPVAATNGGTLNPTATVGGTNNGGYDLAASLGFSDTTNFGSFNSSWIEKSPTPQAAPSLFPANTTSSAGYSTIVAVSITLSFVIIAAFMHKKGII